MGKAKRSDRAHEACCNGHHLYIGKLYYKKILIIKINKMLESLVIVFLMFTILFYNTVLVSDYISDFEGVLVPSISSYLLQY